MTPPRTYLDYNASAPLRPEAREAMLAALDVTGNASSIHAEGRLVRAIVERARDEVAALVNAKPSEVVFTSGATEANVWALTAGWQTVFAAGIEHDSVLSPVRAATKLAALPVDRNGVVKIDALAALLSSPDTRSARCCVALQMANNETGVIQPVADVAAIAAAHGVPVHSDAVQAAGRVPIDFRALGVATLSLSAHKLGGPKGAGALIIRDGTLLKAMITGGGQERRRRAGTENVAAIAGFGAAAAVARTSLSGWAAVKTLRDRLEAALRTLTPQCVIIAHAAPRLANTTCVALRGQLAETHVIKFDLAGVAISAGAACSSGKAGASHVLAAIGLDEDISRCAVRVSLGLATSEQDIEKFLAVWVEAVGQSARAA